MGLNDVLGDGNATPLDNKAATGLSAALGETSVGAIPNERGTGVFGAPGNKLYRGIGEKDYNSFINQKVKLEEGSDWYKERAYNQSHLDQFGNMMLKLVPNLVGGVLEDYGAIAELPAKLTGNYEYENGLSTLGKIINEGVNEALPNYTAGYDSGYFFDKTGGLISGLGQMWATGWGIGKGLGLLAKGIELAGKASKVAKVAEFGFGMTGKAQGLAASTAGFKLTPAMIAGARAGGAASSFAMGYVMSSANAGGVYKQVYDKQFADAIEQGKDTETATKIATEKATESAHITLGIGTTALGTLFSMSSIFAPFGKGTAKQVRGELLEDINKAYVPGSGAKGMIEAVDKAGTKIKTPFAKYSQPAKDALLFSGMGATAKLSAQEGLIHGGVQEREDAEDIADVLFSTEGGIEAASGLIMGAVMGGLFRHIPNFVTKDPVMEMVPDASGNMVYRPKTSIVDGKPVMERKGYSSAYQKEKRTRQQLNEVLKAGLKNDLNKLVTYGEKLKVANEIVAKQQEVFDNSPAETRDAAEQILIAAKREAERARQNMFDAGNTFSFRHGMEDNLITVLKDISEIDNTKILDDTYDKQIEELTKSKVGADEAKVKEIDEAIAKLTEDKAKDKGKTEAMKNGLATDMNDNNYKTLAKEHIEEIKTLKAEYDKLQDRTDWSIKERHSDIIDYTFNLFAEKHRLDKFVDKDSKLYEEALASYNSRVGGLKGYNLHSVIDLQSRWNGLAAAIKSIDKDIARLSKDEAKNAIELDRKTQVRDKFNTEFIEVKRQFNEAQDAAINHYAKDLIEKYDKQVAELNDKLKAASDSKDVKVFEARITEVLKEAKQAKAEREIEYGKAFNDILNLFNHENNKLEALAKSIAEDKAYSEVLGKAYNEMSNYKNRDAYMANFEKVQKEVHAEKVKRWSDDLDATLKTIFDQTGIDDVRKLLVKNKEAFEDAEYNKLNKLIDEREKLVAELAIKNKAKPVNSGATVTDEVKEKDIDAELDVDTSQDAADIKYVVESRAGIPPDSVSMFLGEAKDSEAIVDGVIQPAYKHIFDVLFDKEFNTEAPVNIGINLDYMINELGIEGLTPNMTGEQLLSWMGETSNINGKEISNATLFANSLSMELSYKNKSTGIFYASLEYLSDEIELVNAIGNSKDILEISKAATTLAERLKNSKDAATREAIIKETRDNILRPLGINDKITDEALNGNDARKVSHSIDKLLNHIVSLFKYDTGTKEPTIEDIKASLDKWISHIKDEYNKTDALVKKFIEDAKKSTDISTVKIVGEVTRKDNGTPYKIEPVNVNETFDLDKLGTTYKIGTVGKDGHLYVNDGTTDKLDTTLGKYTPGEIYLISTDTLNGKQYPFRLLRSKLSKEGVDVIEAQTKVLMDVIKDYTEKNGIPVSEKQRAAFMKELGNYIKEARDVVSEHVLYTRVDKNTRAKGDKVTFTFNTPIQKDLIALAEFDARTGKKDETYTLNYNIKTNEISLYNETTKKSIVASTEGTDKVLSKYKELLATKLSNVNYPGGKDAPAKFKIIKAAMSDGRLKTDVGWVTDKAGNRVSNFVPTGSRPMLVTVKANGVKVGNKAYPPHSSFSMGESSKGKGSKSNIKDVDKAIKANQKLVKRPKKGATGSDNKYVVNGVPLDRVSERTAEMPGASFDGDSTRFQASRDAGDTIDLISKAIFNNEKVPTRDITPTALTKLTSELEAIKAKIASDGMTLVWDTEGKEAKGVVVFDIENNVGGELDMLVKDKAGNYYIYDIKTSQDFSDSVYNEPPRYKKGVNAGKYVLGEDGKPKLSKREQHTNQLSAYTALFEKQYGVKIAGIVILPFEIKYNADGQISNIVRKDSIKLTYNPKVEPYIFKNKKSTKAPDTKDKNQDEIDNEFNTHVYPLYDLLDVDRNAPKFYEGVVKLVNEGKLDFSRFSDVKRAKITESFEQIALAKEHKMEASERVELLDKLMKLIQEPPIEKKDDIITDVNESKGEEVTDTKQVVGFPEKEQKYKYDCGACALQQVFEYHGIKKTEEQLIKELKTTPKSGTNVKKIVKVAKENNIPVEHGKTTIDNLLVELEKGNVSMLPIQYDAKGKITDFKDDWKDGHYVVLIGTEGDKLVFEDPASKDRLKLTRDELMNRWHDKAGRQEYVNYAITFKKGNVKPEVKSEVKEEVKTNVVDDTRRNAIEMERETMLANIVEYGDEHPFAEPYESRIFDVSGSYISGKTLLEIQSKIKARYDAKLAELDNPIDSTTKNDIKDIQDSIDFQPLDKPEWQDWHNARIEAGYRNPSQYDESTFTTMFLSAESVDKYIAKYPNLDIRKGNVIKGYHEAIVYKPTTRYYDEQIDVNKTELTDRKELEDIIRQFNNKSNIPFTIIDESSEKYKGYYNEREGKSVINMAHADMSSPFHEFAHPFLNAIQLHNPKLYSNFKNEIDKVDVALISRIHNDTTGQFSYKDSNGNTRLTELGYKEAMSDMVGKYGKDQLKEEKHRGLRAVIRDFLKDVAERLGKVFRDLLKKDNILPKELDPNMTLKDLTLLIRYAKGKIEINADDVRKYKLNAADKLSNETIKLTTSNKDSFFKTLDEKLGKVQSDLVKEHVERNGLVDKTASEIAEHVRSKYTNIKPRTADEIGYQFKLVNNITSNMDKINKWFTKGVKFNTDAFYKKLQDLQIPKEQIELFKQCEGDTLEERLIDFTSKYTYTVESKVATRNTNSYDWAVSNKEEYDKIGEFEDIASDAEHTYLKTSEEGIRYKKALNSSGTYEYYVEKRINVPIQIYSNLTVPGGTNYTENRIVTPIEPSIRGHAQFAEANDIGWFRSDEEGVLPIKDFVVVVERNGIPNVDAGPFVTREEAEQYNIDNNLNGTISTGIQYYDKDIIPTNTRRILEIQSDLFQKGRTKDNLVIGNIESFDEVPYFHFKDTEGRASLDFEGRVINREGKPIIQIKTTTGYEDASTFSTLTFQERERIKTFVEPLIALKKRNSTANSFLQLLNKDNNWHNFFIKSIIQDSAKKGYEYVLFPKGDTASKVEGHTTLEEFKKQKEDRIKELEKRNDITYKQETDASGTYYRLWNREEPLTGTFLTEIDAKNRANELGGKYDNEIAQLEAELQRLETEGFGALRPIYKFYEDNVSIIVKKLGGEDYKDEHGNGWVKYKISDKDNNDFLFQPIDTATINGKPITITDADAQTVRVTADKLSKEDVLAIIDNVARTNKESIYFDTKYKKYFEKGEYTNTKYNDKAVIEYKIQPMDSIGDTTWVENTNRNNFNIKTADELDAVRNLGLGIIDILKPIVDAKNAERSTKGLEEISLKDMVIMQYESRANNPKLSYSQQDLLRRAVDDLRTNTDADSLWESIKEGASGKLKYDIVEKEVESSEDNVSLTRTWGDKDKIDGRDGVSIDIKRMIRTSPMIGKGGRSNTITLDNGKLDTNLANYDVVNNELTGQPNFLDYTNTTNKLFDVLSGATNLKDMMRKLRIMATYNPSLIRIADRIENDTDLQDKFYRSFAKRKQNKTNIYVVKGKKFDKLIVKNDATQVDNLRNEWLGNIDINMESLDFNKLGLSEGMSKLADKIVVDTKLDNVNKHVEDVVELFNELGIDISAEELNNHITKKTTATHNQLDVLKESGGIVEILRELGKHLVDPTHIVEGRIKDLASKVAEFTGKGIELTTLTVKREKQYNIGDTSYIHETFKEYKSDNPEDIKALTDTVTQQILNIPDFKYLNLFQLKDDKGNFDIAAIVNRLRSINLLSIGGILNYSTRDGLTYGELNDVDWSTTLMSLYVARGEKGMVNVPGKILSDSSENIIFQVPNIRLKSGDIIDGKLSDKSGLFNALINVVKQEIARQVAARNLMFSMDKDGIYHLNEEYRKMDGTSDITGLEENYHYEFDKATQTARILKDGKPTGRIFKFHSIPELNKIEGLTTKGLINDLLDNEVKHEEEWNKIKEVVSKYAERIYQGALKSLAPDKESIQQLIDTTNNPNIPKVYENVVREAVLNKFIMNNEAAALWYGVDAEYGSGLDVIKRMKQLTSPHRMSSGNKVRPEIVSVVVHDIKDKSPIIEDIKKILDASNLDATRKKDTIKDYSNITTGDGFTLMSDDLHFRMLSDDGQASKYAEGFRYDEAKDKYYYIPESGVELPVAKPFAADREMIAEGNGYRMVSNMRKNSMVAIGSLHPQENSELAHIQKWMDDNNVDVFTFRSTDKVGVTDITRIHDENNNLIPEKLDDIIKFNRLKITKSKFLGLQQDTHDKLNSDNKASIQASRIMLTDFGLDTDFSHPNIKNTTKVKGKDIINYAHKVQEAILKENSQEIIDKHFSRVEDIKQLYIKNLIENNASEDIKSLAKYGNEQLVLLNNMPSFTKKMQSIGLSLFTNGVTNFRMNGFHAVLVSNVFNKAIGGKEIVADKSLKARMENGIPIYECAVPVWDNRFYIGGKKENGVRPIEEIPKELLRLFAYRIPYSGVHSGAILEVKYFLESGAGASMKIADDIIARTNCDFDIDSFFVHARNFKTKEGITEEDRQYLMFTLNEALRKAKLGTLGDTYGTKEKEIIDEAIEKATTDWDNATETQQLIKKVYDANPLKDTALELEDYDLDNIDAASAKGKQNALLDIWMSIMTHPDSAARQVLPAAFAPLTESAEYIRKHLGRSDDNFNSNDPLHEEYMKDIAYMGKSTLGAGANTSGALAIIQSCLDGDVRPTLGVAMEKKYHVLHDDTGAYIKHIKDNIYVTEEQLVKRYGKENIVFYDAEGNEVTSLDKANNFIVSSNTITYTKDGKFDSLFGGTMRDNLAMIIDNAADNIKTLLPPNVNLSTINAWVTAALTDGDVHHANMFINQPIISNYLKHLKDTKRIINTGDDKPYFAAKTQFQIYLYEARKKQGLKPIAKVEERIKEGKLKGLFYKDSEQFKALDYDPSIKHVFSTAELEGMFNGFMFEGDSQYKNLSVEEQIEFNIKQLKILDIYQEYETIGKKLLNIFNKLSLDKQGAGVTLNENKQASDALDYDMYEKTDSTIVINDTPLLNAIFRDTNSVYPTLQAYRKYSNEIAYNTLAPMYISERGMFKDTQKGVLNALGNPVGKTAKLIGDIVSKYQFNEVLADTEPFAINGEGYKRLLGVNSPAIRTNKDISLDEFKQLSAANQLYIMQKKAGLNKEAVHILNYLKADLSTSEIQKNGFHFVKLAKEVEDSFTEDKLKNTLMSMYYSKDEYMSTLADSLLRHSYHTFGLGFTGNSYGHLIPARLLVKLGLDKYIDEENQRMLLDDADASIGEGNKAYNRELVDIIIRNNEQLIPAVYNSKHLDYKFDYVPDYGTPDWTPKKSGLIYFKDDKQHTANIDFKVLNSEYIKWNTEKPVKAKLDKSGKPIETTERPYNYRIYKRIYGAYALNKEGKVQKYIVYIPVDKLGKYNLMENGEYMPRLDEKGKQILNEEGLPIQDKRSVFTENRVDKSEEEYIDVVNKLFKLNDSIRPLEAKDIDTDSTADTTQVIIKDHNVGSYKERTIENAKADATIHIAMDFDTLGEKLTKSSVLKQDKKYIKISPMEIHMEVDRAVRELNSIGKDNVTLNIAGNAIDTLAKLGKFALTQEEVDNMTYKLLEGIVNSPNLKTKITSVRTGGQTGFDEAGAKAAIKLGIPTTILAPKGYKFRDINGKDISNEKAFKDRFGITDKPSGQLDLFEQRLSDLPKDTQDNINRKSTFLKDTFAKHGIKIDVESDINIKFNSEIQDNVIKYNPLKAREDSILHEFGHAYVDMIGYNDPFIKLGIEQLRDTKLWNDIKELYSDKTTEQFEKEVLTTAIGTEASKLWDSKEKQGKFMFWVNRLFSKIGEILNKLTGGKLGNPQSVARDLAYDMVRGRLRNKLNGSLSEYAQYQKGKAKDAGDEPEGAEVLLERAKAEKKTKMYYRKMAKAMNSANTSIKDIYYKKLAVLDAVIKAGDRSAFVENEKEHLNALNDAIEKYENTKSKADLAEAVTILYNRNVKELSTSLPVLEAMEYDLSNVPIDMLPAAEQDIIKSKINRALSFVAEFDSIKNLEFISKELMGTDTKEADVKLNDIITKSKELEKDISNLSVIANRLLKAWTGSTIINLSTNPKFTEGEREQIVQNVQEALDNMKDESRLKSILDPIYDSANPIIANVAKLHRTTVDKYEFEGKETVNKFMIKVREFTSGDRTKELTKADSAKLEEFTKKITNRMGNFIREYDWDMFHTAKKIAFGAIDNMNITKAAKRTAKTKWFNENTTGLTRKQAEEMKAKAKAIMTAEEYKEFLNTNFDARGYLKASDDLRNPIDKYKDKVYSTLTPKELDMYEFLTEEFNKLWTGTGKEGGRIGMVAKDYSVKQKDKDTVFRMATDAFGDPVFNIPLHNASYINQEKLIYVRPRKVGEDVKHYTAQVLDQINKEWGTEFTTLKEVDARNDEIKARNKDNHAAALSKDLVKTFPLFVKSINKFKAVKSIETDLKLALHSLKQSNFVVQKGVYDKVVDMVRKNDKGEPEVKTIPGTQTRLYEHYKKYLEMVVAEMFTDASTGDAFLKLVDQFTVWKGLGLNYFSAFKNVHYGISMNLVEAAGKQYFDFATGTAGNKDYVSNIPSLIADFNRLDGSSSTLENAQMKYYDILFAQDELKQKERGIVSRRFRDSMQNIGFFLQHTSEHYIQNQTLFAMLHSHRVVDGKIMSLFDYLDKNKYSIADVKSGKLTKDVVKQNRKTNEQLTKEFEQYPKLKECQELSKEGYIKFKDKVKVGDKEVAVKINEGEIERFKEKVIGVNHRLNGIYNVQDKGVIENKVIGQLAMTFRHWIRPGWNKRFAGEGIFNATPQWNERLGAETIGDYKAFFKVLALPFTKEFREQHMSAEDKGAMATMQAIVKGYGEYFSKAQLYWHTLSAYEKAGVRRTAMELSLLASTMVASAILGMIINNQTEKEGVAFTSLVFLQYQLDATQSELRSYHPVYGWGNEGTKIMANPMASFNTIKTAWQLNEAIFKYPFQTEEERKYKGTRHHGEYKVMYYGKRFIPVITQIQRGLDLRANDKYYRLWN